MNFTTRLLVTTLFKEQVVGGSFEIVNDINTTTHAAGDFLTEQFTFTFKGNLTLKESCPKTRNLKNKKP